jgi:sigma-E factor negative regulatory protein RseB
MNLPVGAPGILAVMILAFPTAVPPAIAQTDTTALQWLQRIYAATRKLNYTGTFVYQHGQQVETSRITHLVDAAGLHEKLEALDGVPREIFRTRDEVVCYMPESMTVKIDKQLGQRPFLAILPEQLKELSENYSIRKGEVERAGGYNCQLIVLEPKDRMRYGHRLCAELSSGMLLKAKTFDEHNEVLEQFAFTHIDIGGHIDRNKLKPRFSRKSPAWHVEDSDATRANLAESGWSIRSAPPGFHTVTELIRTLGGTTGVGHIVLSDGIAAVSVFIQPAESRSPAPQPGLARQGAINVYVRQVGSHWITVVGEAPAESVKYIANAVEYRR